MIKKNELQEALTLDQFPRAAKYDVEGLIENEMGPCAVWLMEYLAEAMDLKPGMRVLDMGCGMAMSSIFLAREFGVQVWATDLWIKASDNFKRIKDYGVSDLVYPIHADVQTLPYAQGFFDAIISVDSYHYYGTDEMFLPYFIKFLKPGGQIGIVVPGVKEEFNGKAPERLKPYWEPYLFTHHTPIWWKELWERSEAVNVKVADTLPNGYEIWLKWDKTLKEAGVLKRNGDVAMLEADGGNFTFTRIVGIRL